VLVECLIGALFPRAVSAAGFTALYPVLLSH
jgi:hypothetical protein